MGCRVKTKLTGWPFSSFRCSIQNQASFKVQKSRLAACDWLGRARRVTLEWWKYKLAVSQQWRASKMTLLQGTSWVVGVKTKLAWWPFSSSGCSFQNQVSSFVHCLPVQWQCHTKTVLSYFCHLLMGDNSQPCHFAFLFLSVQTFHSMVLLLWERREIGDTCATTLCLHTSGAAVQIGVFKCTCQGWTVPLHSKLKSWNPTTHLGLRHMMQGSESSFF